MITLGICAEMTRGANMVWAADESRVHVLFWFGFFFFGHGEKQSGTVTF